MPSIVLGNIDTLLACFKHRQKSLIHDASIPVGEIENTYKNGKYILRKKVVSFRKKWSREMYYEE